MRLIGYLETSGTDNKRGTVS